MFSNIENSASSYQRISEYVGNIRQENDTIEALEISSVDSANVASSNSVNVASGLTTSLNSDFSSTESQGNLFVPILGQSNGEHMSIVYDPYQSGSTSNTTSGATVLDQDLSNITGQNVVTSSSEETNFAVGGSKVNGNGYYQPDDSQVWWYPDQNQPGGALRQAEQGVRQWLADSGAQPNDEIAIVWSQGESDVGDLDPSDPSSVDQYKQSTNATFDYLKNSLGYSNVTFYLVPTGRLQAEAAVNAGLDDNAIDSIEKGVGLIRNAQEEIALGRDDVQLATDYSDLNMVYEEGQLYGGSYDQDYSRWSQDFWHLGHDGLKVNGSRLAQYIALDKGQNNVISFTDSFGNSAESVSIARNGILDLNISENSVQGEIAGTDNPDLLVGTLSADEITGGNGNDVIVASQGIDNLTGGSGSDVFFYDAAVYPDLSAHYDLISDFEVYSDLLDVSEPLALAGYDGSDPVADGYVTVNPTGDNSLEVTLDLDGAGEQSAGTIAILENVDLGGFQNDINNQFIFTSTEF